VTRSLLRSAIELAAFPLGVALVAGDAHGEDIYTYTDAEGVVHFQNRNKKGKVYAKATRKKRAAPAPFMPTESSADRNARYDEIIGEAATLYQIPEALVRAVIKVESNFDPRAVSHANARGLMQLIPQTAERMMVTDIFDPRQNILGGVRYLRVLANLFNGNLELTIAAYNAGENAVMRHGGIPPFPETQDYVVRVLSYYRIYRGA
jgi:soluble lytic murein transglycosylase-like protein